MRYTQELALAKRAAKEAGIILKLKMVEKSVILSEDAHDIKIQADRDSEDLILKILEGSDFPILTEERGELGSVDEESTFWVIDPLDGTYNYTREIPFCCVSIALFDGGTSVLGAIYDFNHDELFSGYSSGGAWLNDNPIEVSDINDTRIATLMTGFPSKGELDSASLVQFMKETSQFEHVLMEGSAALMLAHVACGKADAYREEDVMLWDIAAGVAIISGAGGYVDVQLRPGDRWGRIVKCSANELIWSE